MPSGGRAWAACHGLNARPKNMGTGGLHMPEFRVSGVRKGEKRVAYVCAMSSLNSITSSWACCAPLWHCAGTAGPPAAWVQCPRRRVIPPEGSTIQSRRNQGAVSRFRNAVVAIAPERGAGSLGRTRIRRIHRWTTGGGVRHCSARGRVGHPRVTTAPGVRARRRQGTGGPAEPPCGAPGDRAQ